MSIQEKHIEGIRWLLIQSGINKINDIKSSVLYLHGKSMQKYSIPHFGEIVFIYCIYSMDTNIMAVPNDIGSSKAADPTLISLLTLKQAWAYYSIFDNIVNTVVVTMVNSN